MSYVDAKHILDQARDGIEFDKTTINAALALMGDLEHIPFFVPEKTEVS